MNVASLLDCLAASLAWVARVSWQASVVAVLVVVAQALLRGRVSARWRYGLWLLVVARLILPTLPATRFSPFNWLRIEAPAEAVAAATLPRSVRGPAVVPRHDPAPSPREKERVIDPPIRAEVEMADSAHSPGNQGDAVPTDARDASASYPRDSDAPAAKVPAQNVPTPSSPVLPAAVHRVTPVRGIEPSPEIRRNDVSPIPQSASSPVIARWPAISLRQAVAGIWAVGAWLMLMRVLWATGRLARIIRRLPRVNDPDIEELVQECASRSGLRRCPCVLEAPEGTGPALAGVLRPRLLLPAAALRGLGRNELRLVVMHELVHLRRGDLALNWLLAILQSVHWFNPAVWFAFARLRADRELACDELVLSSSPPGRRGNDCRDYGRAILKLLDPPPSGTVPGLAVGVLDGGGWVRKAQLRRRITMIARFDRPAGRWPALGVALSLLVGGVAFTGAVRGEDEPSVKPSAAGGAGVANDPAGPPGQPSGGGFLGGEPAGGGYPGGAPVGGGLPGVGPAGGTPGPAAGPGASAGPSGFVPAPGTPNGLLGAGGPPGMGARMGPGAMSPPGSNGRPAGSPPPTGVGGRPGMGGPMMGAIGGIPGPGGGGIGRVEDPEASKADAKTAGLLHKSITASMQGVPLDEFLHYMADQTGADIFLDSKALTDQQIVPDAPVTLHVREPRPAHTLLELGLRSAAGDSLGYEVSNGLVIVTTRAVLDRTTVTRSYDVGKLIDIDPGVDLRLLIQDAVAPGSWRSPGDNSGGGGAIGLFNRKLIVNTTEPHHREIARLLDLLEEKPDKGGEAGSEAQQSRLKRSVQDFASQLANLEMATAEAETTLGSNHPRIIELKRRREIMRQQLNARKAELDGGRQQLDPNADPTRDGPVKPGSKTGGGNNPFGDAEGPSSSIRADQIDLRIDPNLTVTARGNVEVHSKPTGNSGNPNKPATGSLGESSTQDPNATNTQAGSNPPQE